MLHLIATLLLIIAAGVLTILALRPTAGSPQTRYLAVSALLLFVTATLVPEPVDRFYKAAVVLGLTLYLINQLLQLLPGLPAVVNYVLTGMGVMLYMAAFASAHPLKWPTPWLILPLVAIGALYWRLRPYLAELHGSIIVYLVAFFLLLWQGIEMNVVNGALWALLGILGAIGLAIAQLLVGIDHFIRPIQQRQWWVQSTMFIGYVLIIFSIWGPALAQPLRWP